ASGAVIFDTGLPCHCSVGYGIDRILTELECHTFGTHQRHILLDQRGFRLGENTPEIVAGECLELHADGQAALQLGQQIRRFGDMKCPGRDKQYVVGFHRPMLGIDGSSLDQRQQVTLHALARYIGAAHALAACDLVDLVEENDSVLLDCSYCFLPQLLIVEQFVGFLVDQYIVRFLDRDSARLGTPTAELSKNVADIDGTHLCPWHPRNLEHRHASAARLYLDLDFLVVEFSVAQLFAETFARSRACSRTDECVEYTLFSRLL